MERHREAWGDRERDTHRQRERQKWRHEDERKTWGDRRGSERQTVRQTERTHTLVLFPLKTFRFWVNWCKIGC